MRGAAAVVLVLALAGCGSDSTSPKSTLTAAEWRRQANAICRDLGRQIRAVPQPVTQGDVLTFTATVSPLWRLQEDRFRALVPPDELVDPWEELADVLAEINVSVLEIHIATQRRDGQRRDDGVRRAEAAASSFRLRSQELELPACARQRIP